MDRRSWARDLARTLLAEQLPRRWAHTRGVGAKAESIAHLAGEDADLLSCAAWLHDIGYAPALARTGFHPLDGARYLRQLEHVEERLCRLVAHHSCAIVEARARGLAGELVAEFAPVDGLLADALTYCDMTTSPYGRPVSVDVRFDEVIARYGDGDPVAESMKEARVRITESARVVSAMLAR